MGKQNRQAGLGIRKTECSTRNTEYETWCMGHEKRDKRQSTYMWKTEQKDQMGTQGIWSTGRGTVTCGKGHRAGGTSETSFDRLKMFEQVRLV